MKRSTSKTLNQKPSNKDLKVFQNPESSIQKLKQMISQGKKKKKTLQTKAVLCEYRFKNL